MFKEFEPYLDFWVEGQKQGFAGQLPRIKNPDGSKMVVLSQGNLLYLDRWFGSDIGGGQTLLYELTQQWNPEKPLEIVGNAKAKLSYSGEIIRRFTEEELVFLRQFYPTQSHSDIIWSVLKKALSQVSRERPFRGPKFFIDDRLHSYKSKEEKRQNGIIGQETINL